MKLLKRVFCLDMDEWITLEDKLGYLTTCVNTKKACCTHLCDVMQGRVSLFMKKPYLHIREYYIGDDGQDKPTATGISLSSVELSKFIQNLPKIKSSVQILHTLPNTSFEGEMYTLYLEKEEEGIFTYMFLEKGVMFSCKYKDLEMAVDYFFAQQKIEHERMLKIAKTKRNLGI